jgi:hypothetical protein
LLVGEDGADPLGEYAAVSQLLIIQQPPDLGQPDVGERAVVVSGPAVQQRDAFEAEQVGKRVFSSPTCAIRSRWNRSVSKPRPAA